MMLLDTTHNTELMVEDPLALSNLNSISHIKRANENFFNEDFQHSRAKEYKTVAAPMYLDRLKYNNWAIIQPE